MQTALALPEHDGQPLEEVRRALRRPEAGIGVAQLPLFLAEKGNGVVHWAHAYACFWSLSAGEKFSTGWLAWSGRAGAVCASR